ncbi:hypothetical protein COEREDRAFT_87802 [Coemansia reversa NRRL 1564]|uniref:WD40 repeat-like protein n=1 Tax=Coemansia reversa (strain ATCC 12441 / NRRL 1564) TaxID=763665 RepID=A0A2G5B9C6_COERN|nr:hypothetical protein COEREDRAFT_87802 [Coemansia reversa NRRL 1564]|eukprot:PIA15619.1 hypothetical protein COEREDRAFT_87802 [Coemansia reversa NRRL 1564]
MNGSGTQSNSLFNAFTPVEHPSRRFSDQRSTVSQTPASAYGETRDGQFSGFSSPSLSNTTLQQPSKEISFSLLQALLKPQAAQGMPPSTQTHPGTQSHVQQASNPESALGQPTDTTAFFQKQQLAQDSDTSPMEQLKRMMAAQSSNAGNTQLSAYQQQQHIPVQAVGNNSALPSTYSSPHLNALTDTSVSASANIHTASSTKASTPTRARAKTTTLNIDLKKVRLRGKPETVPISLLQQPMRFRAGRMISVSREYICYAVRSKEGGHIRVIHQLHGQLAKMLGHKDSIIDMEFHPCSKESGMPQVLASLGKDNRLIVWLVGPVDMQSTSAEGAISYEPFVNIDSGGDAQFTCLAWRGQIVDHTMELCVGTDKGFMVVKAPAPSAKGKRAEASNEGLNVMPISTDSAVTAIVRAGLHWVVVATADRTVRIHQLDSHWESSSRPHWVVGELGRSEQAVDSLIYAPPAMATDGAGHVLVGSSMNKTIQLWWLGSSPQQSTLLQTVTLAGSSSKPASLFAKIAWAEQGRCLTVGSNYAPSAIFVLKAYGHGAAMHLNYPHGFNLGDEQPILSVVAAMEPQGPGASPDLGLSVYSVHTRLVQQLQIPGLAAVESQGLPDPADIYADPSIMTLLEVPQASHAPVHNPTLAAESVAAPSLSATQQQSEKDPATVPAFQQATLGSVANAAGIPASAQMQADVAAALSGLRIGDTGASIALDSESEERLAVRIGSIVEKRVAENVAAAMERTLIPAYTRATAAMFEQMHSTFEAGLREWWMRFAQAMPMPPPLSQQQQITTPQITASHITTPHSHMAVMPQPQQVQGGPQPYTSSMHPQPLGAAQAHMVPMPQFMPNTGAAVPSSAVNHIDSLKTILNLQPSAGQPKPHQPSF